MGKLHGQRVDLFTASAIQQVYNALNKKNQAKMVSVMSKDVHGLLKDGRLFYETNEKIN